MQVVDYTLPEAAREFGVVAVARPVRGEFTYRIPPALRRQLKTGMRIQVPFRNGIALGFFLAFTEQVDEALKPRLKAIDSLLDAEPALTADVVSLARFAAAHYRSPLGECLKAALPPGLTDMVWQKELSPDVVEWWQVDTGIDIDTFKRAPAQQAVLEYLVAVGGRATADEVAHALRGSRTPAKRLIERGVLQVAREAVDPLGQQHFKSESRVELTDEQRAAVEVLQHAVDAEVFAPFLLYGVTGSGKTEVYLRLVEHALSRGKGALVLVPEIALTPQLVGRFRSRFGGHVAVLHSGLKTRERLLHWQRLRRGEVKIAVGVRSAIFAPVADLGVLIVDEEHEPSFKQEEKLRYHARDLSVVRANHRKALVVLGSATPSLETLENVRRGKYQVVRLTRRVDARPLPDIELIDLRVERPRNAAAPGEELPMLSPPLQKAIAETLAAQQQTILFLNRRGHSTFSVCEVCGTTVKCQDCDVCLTLHRSSRSLQCHYCGRHQPVAPACSSCGGRVLQMGVGTEKIEEEVQALFPAARVARLDRDAVSGMDELTQRLAAFARRDIDILVGTQMVAKGHDFPGVTLVAVILADAALALPDFRSAERSVQLLTQVAGRAGRGTAPGRVLIQSYLPEAAPLTAVARGDFDGFSENELKRRHALNWPPTARLVAVRIEGADVAATAKAAKRIGEVAESVIVKGRLPARLLGPALAPVTKIKGASRWQLMLKASHHSTLTAVLDAIENAATQLPNAIRVVVDVDPSALL